MQVAVVDQSVELRSGLVSEAPWAASGLKSQRRPLAAELGSNLRTILRTCVDFQEKTVPSKSLRTVGMTFNAP